MKVATRPMAVKPGADPIAQARLATSAIVSLSAEPRFARSLQRPANRGRSCRDRLARSRSVALNFVSPRVENIDIVGDFNCNVYAQRVFYIEPTTTFTLDTSLNVVLMVVIGGAASWQGPLIGSSVVLLVAQFLRVTVTSEANRVIFSLIVILVALFVPRGVMGAITQARRPRGLAATTDGDG